MKFLKLMRVMNEVEQQLETELLKLLKQLELIGLVDVERNDVLYLMNVMVVMPYESLFSQR